MYTGLNLACYLVLASVLCMFRAAQHTKECVHRAVWNVVSDWLFLGGNTLGAVWAFKHSQWLLFGFCTASVILCIIYMIFHNRGKRDRKVAKYVAGEKTKAILRRMVKTMKKLPKPVRLAPQA